MEAGEVTKKRVNACIFQCREGSSTGKARCRLHRMRSLRQPLPVFCEAERKDADHKGVYEQIASDTDMDEWRG